MKKTEEDASDLRKRVDALSKNLEDTEKEYQVSVLEACQSKNILKRKLQVNVLKHIYH